MIDRDRKGPLGTFRVLPFSLRLRDSFAVARRRARTRTAQMLPTKFLIGQVVIVFAVVIGGVWFATQLAAHDLGYQSRLGAPWTVIAGLPVYAPWRLFQWWFVYDAYAPHIFTRAGIVASAS